MNLGSHLCTHDGGVAGWTVAAAAELPSLEALRFASRRAMFSLQTRGRIPQNGATLDLGGGGGACFMSHCRRSPASLIASADHCCLNASRARASAIRWSFSASFLR